MIGACVVILKNLVRSSLDNYILPGTLTGTEILLLYMLQWKRVLVAVASLTVSIFLSRFDLPTLERVFSQYRSDVGDND